VLRQTCARLRRRDSYRLNVTALFRVVLEESGQKQQEIQPVACRHDHLLADPWVVSRF
jgi:hypothetical protein